MSCTNSVYEFTYTYGARWYDAVLGRFTTMDPLCEEDYSVSPYVYCLNNPIRLIDTKGKEPGDFFVSTVAAAEDFGKFYNTLSIIESREYSSFIYKTKDAWGNTAYSYTVPRKGGIASSSPDLNGFPRGAKIEAFIHSHGDYVDRNNDGISDFHDNTFSDTDKELYKNKQKDGYVVTPNGSLLQYSVKNNRVYTISTAMPKKVGKTKDGKKIIKNVYTHKSLNKTAEQRKTLLYEQKKAESFWDKWIYSVLIPIR